MTFEIFLNILIIALLIIGIVYAIVLEHRLSSSKENRRELAILIDQFYKASQKTSAELIHLKELEEQARAGLKADLEKAALIRDELNFLLGKVKKTLDEAPTYSHEPQIIDPKTTTEIPYSEAEEELIAALNALK